MRLLYYVGHGWQVIARVVLARNHDYYKCTITSYINQELTLNITFTNGVVVVNDDTLLLIDGVVNPKWYDVEDSCAQL